MALSLAISGIAVQFEVRTGNEDANASMMGKPKPSYRLGKVSPQALCKSANLSCSLT